MYASDVLPGSQQSERSRQWAAGSTSPTVRVPIVSDSDIVVARQQGRALAAAMHFSATDSAFIATTVSELARALFARTDRGEIWLHKVHENERSGVVIVARDPVAHDGGHDSRRAIASDLRLPDVFSAGRRARRCVGCGARNDDSSDEVVQKTVTSHWRMNVQPSADR